MVLPVTTDVPRRAIAAVPAPVEAGKDGSAPFAFENFLRQPDLQLFGKLNAAKFPDPVCQAKLKPKAICGRLVYRH